ncbi:hypothetical protein [Pseudomonas sp. Marseille-P9899]|uniref:hypothetical protein n=1 Tax=Pseudomonas sp. Marseille-P9899 TaxID=2730401 RepID=UPI00158EA741|nr:hypothetical protein [Pseudomonas sp. Marseille-P9899]
MLSCIAGLLPLDQELRVMVCRICIRSIWIALSSMQPSSVDNVLDTVPLGKRIWSSMLIKLKPEAMRYSAALLVVELHGITVSKSRFALQTATACIKQCLVRVRLQPDQARRDKS